MVLSDGEADTVNLRQLGVFPNLTYLDVSSSNFDDDDVVAIARYTSITELIAIDTAVTDLGIKKANRIRDTLDVVR